MKSTFKKLIFIFVVFFSSTNHMLHAQRKRIAVNGFGRIGKAFLRVAFSEPQLFQTIKIVAINVGPNGIENAAYHFKYDSIMGTFEGSVSSTPETLTINGQKIMLLTAARPNDCCWNALEIDWVVEATGKFTQREKAQEHLNAGAKHVLITAPAPDADITIIPGINHKIYNEQNHQIVSMGSCTTNCLAPLLKTLFDENIQIDEAMMETIHAVTNSQRPLDGKATDLRRGRASNNIIPTTTGASKVITRLFPQLVGKFQASAIRVPVTAGSLVRLTISTPNSVTIESLNDIFKKTSKKGLKGIMDYTNEPLVSEDFKGNPHTCIIDGTQTKVINSLVQLAAWYDNEYGYATKIYCLLEYLVNPERSPEHSRLLS